MYSNVHWQALTQHYTLSSHLTYFSHTQGRIRSMRKQTLKSTKHTDLLGRVNLALYTLSKHTNYLESFDLILEILELVGNFNFLC